MRQIFHDALPSKRCLLFVLTAILYFTQTKLTAQCNPDVTPPVAICNQTLFVSLDHNGQLTVPYTNFDLGSTDDCCFGLIKVRRQTDGGCDGDAVADTFASEVRFCCEDIGTPVTVEMRAYDCSDNFSDCFTTVIVEDKLAPVCVPPASITIACSAYDPTFAAHGTDASTDNCCLGATTVTVNTSQFNNSCLQGTIVRTFKVSDCSGNTSQCSQSIVVTYEQDYYVKFPNDIIVTSFNTNVVYGEPVFFGQDCEALDMAYSDQIFTNDPSASVRIERTWQMFNWCTYNGMPFIVIPNPNPHALPNHPTNMPGPIVSESGTAAPWAPSLLKVNSTDPSPTDYSTFWAADVVGYEYTQIIKVIDSFFVAVQGNVFTDTTENCSYDSGEELLSEWTVRATGLVSGQIHEVQTDVNGNYTVLLNGIDTSVNITLVSSANLSQSCQTNYTVAGVRGQTVIQDIPVHLEQRCALLSVGIASPLLRRCFGSRYHVQACNLSGATVNDVSVDVNLDSYLGYLGSSVPGTLQSGNIYKYELGNLRAGECRNFWIDVNVSCDAALGTTHCTEAKIFPYDACSNNANWSGADVDVTALCDGDSIRLKIKNVGNGNMSQVLDFVVAEDIIMRESGNFQLDEGQELKIAYLAEGSTWRLEAQQEPLHPFGGPRAVALEGCGGTNHTGYMNLFPLSNTDPFESIDCQQNIGSYDPNDKQAFPIGFDTDHFLKSNTGIEYLIRFQNTGTDTAFTVKVLDQLSEYLDPASVRVLAASHPFTFSMPEPGLLEFMFANILLPDSNVNLVESNGFLKFRVEQMPDNPEGTRIENDAAIYFDFNDPVITNTTFHTINNHVLTVGVNDPSGVGSGLKVFPNPTAGVATFSFENYIANARFELKNQLGQPIRFEQFSGKEYRFERGGLAAGIYFFNIVEGNGALFSGKILVK